MNRNLQNKQLESLQTAMRARQTQLREEIRQALVKSDSEHYLQIADSVRELEDESFADLIVEKFRDQGTGGVIISTSSIYGEQAAELSFTYSAAKAAVISFTRSAAYELAQYGIRAVAVTPGRVGTPIINQFSEELKSTFAAEQLRGVMTQPEEIANAVAFLASDEANVINGTVVHLDDGYSVFKQRLDLPVF